MYIGSLPLISLPLAAPLRGGKYFLADAEDDLLWEQALGA
jgi:hypothetical protein